jgi:hypothetical protein
MLGWCAGHLAAMKRDQAASGLGGARIGLVDLNRNADVAADRVRRNGQVAPRRMGESQ